MHFNEVVSTVPSQQRGLRFDSDPRPFCVQSEDMHVRLTGESDCGLMCRFQLWTFLGVKPGAASMLPVQPVHHPDMESGTANLPGSRWKSAQHHQPGRAPVHQRFASRTPTTHFPLNFPVNAHTLYLKHATFFVCLPCVRSTCKRRSDGVDWAEPSKGWVGMAVVWWSASVAGQFHHRYEDWVTLKPRQTTLTVA